MNKYHHDTARYDKAFTWKARTIIVAMVGVFGMLGIVLWWSFQPANALSYQDTDLIFLDVYPTDESTGLPILQNGDPLAFTLSFCNGGVTTYTTRWMDRYSGYDQFDDADLEGEALLSYSQPVVVFRSVQEVCGEATDPFTLPYYPRNGVYRYRVETCYEVNPIKTYCEEARTEPFIIEGGVA